MNKYISRVFLRVKYGISPIKCVESDSEVIVKDHSAMCSTSWRL